MSHWDLKHPIQTLRTAFPRKAVIGTLLSVGMACAVASLILFAWLAGEVFEGGTAVFDDSVRVYVHGFAGDRLTSAMTFMSFLGSTIFLTSASVVSALIFIRVRRYRSAVLFSVTMLGAALLNYVLKVSFARVRPIPYFDLPPPASFSFPSGHALCSAAFYGVLAWLLATRIESRLLRLLAWTLAVLLIFCIGLSRIYLG